MKTINTYLPVFSGFYGTFWEAEESNEIESINQERRQKGFKDVEFSEVNFDYKDYENSIGQKVTDYIETFFIELGMIKAINFQHIVSPKYYNFSNDSININIELTQENEAKILSYLDEHKEAFSKYIREKYTSRSGFISHYTNDSQEFLQGNPLEHEHKLGSILDFIFENEGEEEINIYYSIDGTCIMASNYDELINPTIEEIEEEINNSIIEFIIPDSYLPYLINADLEGISEEEKTKIDKFVNDCFVHYNNTFFSVGESVGFEYRNDIDNLGSDCHKVTLLNLATK